MYTRSFPAIPFNLNQNTFRPQTTFSSITNCPFLNLSNENLHQNVTQIHGAEGAALCTSAAAVFDTPRASPEGLGTFNAKPWLQN